MTDTKAIDRVLNQAVDANDVPGVVAREAFLSFSRKWGITYLPNRRIVFIAS